MRYELAFPKEHLRGVDLRGKDVTLTIKAAALEKVKCKAENDEGKTEWVEVPKLVLRFTETDKKLIVNQTNAQTIALVCKSGEIEDWAGNLITVYPKRGKWFGLEQDAIRIREVTKEKK